MFGVISAEEGCLEKKTCSFRGLMWFWNLVFAIGKKLFLVVGKNSVTISLEIGRKDFQII